MISGLRALADQFDRPGDLEKLDRLAAAVVKRKTRGFPHLRDDVEAEVVAALWRAAEGSGYSGDELLRRAWDIARSAASDTLDLLARPMKLDDRTRRRANEAARLRDEEGLSLADAAAQADIAPGTFVAAIDAATSGYIDPADIDQAPDDDYADDPRKDVAAAAVRGLNDDDRRLHDAMHDEGEKVDLPGLPEIAPPRPVIVACAVCVIEPAAEGSVRCSGCRPAPDEVEPWAPPTQRDLAERLGVSQSTISRRQARIARKMTEAASGSAAP